MWIARESIGPAIVKMFDTFKTFWAAKITLVNQTAIPTSLHGYGMAAINNDDASVISYGESIANLGAAYAATQESVKTQGSTITLLQRQVNAMQQYYTALQQQPPPTIYAQPYQQCAPNNHHGLLHHNGSGRGGYQHSGYQQPAGAPTMQASTPFKRFKNGHYCHTHGGDVDDSHTSTTCGKPGPMHNWQATCANMMNGLTVGMHKTILPSASGQAPPVTRAPPIQCPPTPQVWQPTPPPVNFTQMMAAMQLMVPYQAIYHMGEQPPTVPLPPPPAPSAITPYYAPFLQQPAYQHPLHFWRLGVDIYCTKINNDVIFLPCVQPPPTTTPLPQLSS